MDRKIKWIITTAGIASTCFIAGTIPFSGMSNAWKICSMLVVLGAYLFGIVLNYKLFLEGEDLKKNKTPGGKDEPTKEGIKWK